MKKLAAILLIVIFLFNLFGYRLLFNYAQQQSDLRLEASLDKNDFNEAEMITVKVPLSLPYQNNQQNFERINGELKLNGKIYKYVKRKISDGQLILMCLPDYKKMQLQSAKDEFFKYANDLVQNSHSKKPDNSKADIFKIMIGEYDNFTTRFNPSYSFSNIVGYTILNQLNHLPSLPHSSPEQPPELI